MKTRVAAVAVAVVLALTGSIGLAHAESLGQGLVSRSADDASASDLAALGLALADKKFELSGLFGTNLGLTLGLDVWLNQWQTGIPTNDSEGRNIRNTTLTAVGVGFVPNVTLTYDRFFVSASYMHTNDYEFGTTRDIVTISTFDPGCQPRLTILCVFTREQHVEASRQEAEVAFGYRFFETDRGFLGAVVGYKGVFQDFTSVVRFASVTDPVNFGAFQTVTSNSSTRYNGGFIGLVGAASLGGGFGIFGNAAGGALKPNCTPSCPGLSIAPYAAAKVGASYRPFDMPLTFTAAYRVQVINNEFTVITNRTGNVIDLTHGLVLGANWSF
jgi:hypothetical protein